MPILTLLEIPPDALFLHQPANEVGIGLAVLNAVFARLVFTFKRADANAVAADSRILQDGFDDLRHGLVLKNPRAVTMRERPGSGNNLRAVIGLAHRLVGVFQPADDSVKPAG